MVVSKLGVGGRGAKEGNESNHDVGGTCWLLNAASRYSLAELKSSVFSAMGMLMTELIAALTPFFHYF